MSKPDAPEPPDYAAAAQAQGAADKETALQSAILSNPNIITPYGSQTVSYGTQPFPQQPSINPSVEPYGGTEGAYRGGFDRVFGVSGQGATPPGQSSYMGVSIPTITQTFSPEQQALYDQQTRLSGDLNRTALEGLGRVNSVMGSEFSPELTDVQSIDTSGLPELQTLSAEGAPSRYSADFSGLPQVNPLSTSQLPGVTEANYSNLPQMSGVSGQGLPEANAADFSGLPSVNPASSQGFSSVNAPDYSGLPGVTAPSNQGYADVNRADIGQLSGRSVQPGVGGFQDVYNALMERESDRFGRQRSSTEADLLARGFNPGTRGYEERLDDISRAENDFSLGAMLAAGQEQSRLFGLESAGRQQGLNEMLSQQQADQSLRGQQLQEDLGISGAQANLRRQAEGEQLNQFQAGQNLRDQQLREELGLTSANAALRGQAFGEQAQQQQLAQSLRQQGLNERLSVSDTNAARRQQAVDEQLARQQASQSLRAQGANEALNFNQANLGLRQQLGAEQLAQQQAASDLRNQVLGERQLVNSSNAAARQQGLNEQLALQQRSGDQRARELQEAMLMRQLPLSEINALRTGNQPNLPQFQPYSGVNIPSAPIYGAAQDQYAGNLARYNAQAAQRGGLQSGLFGLGSSLFGAAGSAGGFGNLFG